jgi:hypothetical protein
MDTMDTRISIKAHTIIGAKISEIKPGFLYPSYPSYPFSGAISLVRGTATTLEPKILKRLVRQRVIQETA